MKRAKQGEKDLVPILLIVLFSTALALTNCSQEAATSTSPPMPSCVDAVCIRDAQVLLVESIGTSTILARLHLVREDGSIDKDLHLNAPLAINVFQAENETQIASVDIPSIFPHSCQISDDTDKIEPSAVCTFWMPEPEIPERFQGTVRITVSPYGFDALVPFQRTGGSSKPSYWGVTLGIGTTGVGLFLAFRAYKEKKVGQVIRVLIEFVGIGILVVLRSLNPAQLNIWSPWDNILGLAFLFVLISALIINLGDFLRAFRKKEEWCGD